MDLFEIIQERFSVRSFSDKPVEQEKLNRLLEVVQYTPTACNLQPQKVYVLESQESRDKLATVCRFTFNAPVILLICYDQDVAWKNKRVEGYNSGEMDASICCDELMLEAWNLGLGSCWVGAYNPREVEAAFNLPSNIKVAAVLPIGYAADDCTPMAGMHDKTKPLEELVVRL